jgi:nanoRNase/pAp phosphatase (c-di-AMP/oligoRNAs hydrolase)
MSDEEAWGPTPGPAIRPLKSEPLLAALGPFARIVLVSHVNPDPDALGSMMGLEALITARLPGKTVTKTLDGIIARAENQAMVDLLPIRLVPVADAPHGPDVAVVMVDSQPRAARRDGDERWPTVVLDHHDTPGSLDGVQFSDIRPNLGSTCTMVTGYLIEQGVPVRPRLASALWYGIESEISGYPREAGPLDDGALVWLFPRADKNLLAQIRNPRLPQSYFATYQYALTNAFLYGDVVVAWCGDVPQPDIIAEVADFFIRFDQVRWSLVIGRYEDVLKVSSRCDHIGGRCGEVLRAVVDGLGSAGGHDKRAGGAIPLGSPGDAKAVEKMLTELRHRFLAELGIDEQKGRRLLESAPEIDVP